MKKTLFILSSLLFVAVPNLLADELKDLKMQLARCNAEMENLQLDRNNLLKQASIFQKEKNELVSKIEEMQGSRSGAEVELESIKKENELLTSEVEKLKAAREKDRSLFSEEKQAMERVVNDQKARADSVLATMEKYPPDRVEELISDRNRLEEETQRLAQKLIESERQIESIRNEMTPLELDREELFRLQEENKQLNDRIQYVHKLEERQEQLIRENAQYREEVEVLRAKFKDAAPGLAKASRISQKMMKENADMHYNLGTIFLHNKKYREAIQEYERVLELRPMDPETHYNLGLLYDDYLKDREKALYHFQKYLSINPKAPDAKKVESYILSIELEQKVR